jgi:LDH2 family malate/lactate/ureidoglycolate dehydrogenase
METIRLSVAEQRALGCRALTRIGLTADEAEIVTDHLIDNSLCGYAFAGLPRILAMAEAPQIKLPRRPIGILHETPVSALLDGGNHVGYIAVLRGAETALQKARATGVGIVGIAHTWFSGRNAYYLEKIARAGFVGIHTVGGSPMVVPTGATQPALGTNPLAIALPCDPDPFMFDMGTGATTWGEVMLRTYTGENFPDGIGVDAQGRPTNSAAEIAKGGLLPFGGHKGFGLSLAIQAMGLLAGASLAHGSLLDFGPLFIVFDPGILVPRERFKAELSELITTIKALPRQPGVTEIRIPSERAYREREQRRAEGIFLERRVYDRLMAL